ncbi:MAG: hypothetical protein NVV82_25480 [Sporocytophaga sp.]|nr:hypothetical protein [Sporocytophaga sp.]
MAFVGADMKRTTEPGSFDLMVGKLKVVFNFQRR